MSARILVAGIGNIFLGDDGFGVEVARQLSTVDLPNTVRVVDYGIRGMHLAYDMLEGYDVTVLIDTVARGDEPGTVYVIDVTSAGASAFAKPRQPDPHGMTPDAVLGLVSTLGADPGQVFVVGCEPADCDERIGLSLIVSTAVPLAVKTVIDLVFEQLDQLSAAERQSPTQIEV